MFCPKCGIDNPDNGKFCRRCGCDLAVVSDALSGKLTARNKKGSKKDKTWESALTLLFVSFAFFAITIFLAFQPMAAFWWFWLLIPSFAILASGIGQAIALRQDEKDSAFEQFDGQNAISERRSAGELPSAQTEYVSSSVDVKRETGELVPPSVVEGTTRKLEMNSEGETMTLPKTD